MKNLYDTLQIETVFLEKIKYQLSFKLPNIYIFKEENLEQLGRIADDACYRIVASIANQKIKEVSYPANWLEAFKERWLPKFLLKKYPVKYTKWNFSVLYPEIKFPEHQHYIRMEKLT